MKKNLLGLFILVAMVFTACAGPKKAGSKLDVTYVKMWRTSCFGRCASFSVEVYKTGLVRYTGLMFVDDSGIYEKNIGAAKAAEVLNKFSAHRVDTLKADYDLRIADLPGLNYTFMYGKTTKKVNNAQFGPHFLKELAADLDLMVNKTGNGDRPNLDATWKKKPEAAK